MKAAGAPALSNPDDACAQKQQQRAAAAEAAVKLALTKFDQGLTGLRASLTQAVTGVQQGLAQASQGISNALSGVASRVQSAAAIPARAFPAASGSSNVVQLSSQWM
jgi:prophage DNA circulation protein